MKRLIPCVFAFVAAVLVLIFFCRNLFVKDSSFSRAKVVVPLVDTNQIEKEKDGFDYEDDSAQKSFIQLASGEVLIGTVEFDINGDGYDDQVNIVKKSTTPYIWLIIGLYDSEKGTYSRDYSLETTITQVKTFACTGMDVIGNHKNSLVYQGVTDDGKNVLKIFNGSTGSSDKFTLNLIGDFEADGTVYIQQNQRSESYELSKAKGESFPVWVYTSDEKAAGVEGALLDQIQTMYEWNELEKKYTDTKTLRIAGTRVAAKELSRIQDGTVATFGKFLDGLWYKTENSGSNMRFIFFDYSNSEIIFEFEDSEEVYSWLNSNLRRNGIYFSAVNKSIENLQRRFDISLVNVDEIRIKLQDDVRMLISESTLWDGNYKKFVSKELSKPKNNAQEECIKVLVEQGYWSTSNEDTIFHFSDTAYVATSKNSGDDGRYLRSKISGMTLLQFRSNKENPILSGNYLPSFMTESGNSKKTDKNTVVLNRVEVNPEGFYREQSSPIVLKKYYPPKDEETAKLPEVQSYSQSEPGKNSSAPNLSVGISPQYFSPDGDGDYDVLTVLLKAECSAPIKKWSFVINDAESKKEFWSMTGREKVTEKIVWDGKSSKGELVQSATDYPYVFTVTDENGLSNTAKGFIKVDVLVIRDGEKLKLQVPSIFFRSDAADFKSDEDVRSDPKWDGVSKGLTQEAIENNIRVLSRISEILKKFRDYNVTVEGNANNLSGTAREEADVKKLSEERAKFVMDWLIKDGVSASHLKAIGNGSKNPVTLSTKIEDKWKNRRVEFILEK